MISAALLLVVSAHFTGTSGKSVVPDWAILLADGYYSGVVESVEHRPDDARIGRLIVRDSNGPHEIRFALSDLQEFAAVGSRHTIFYTRFAQDGVQVDYLLAGPTPAVFAAGAFDVDLKPLQERAMLDNKPSDNQADCKAVNSNIKLMSTRSYQKAISEFASSVGDMKVAECLASAIEITKKFPTRRFYDPFTRSHYHPPFDSVGELCAYLLPRITGIDLYVWPNFDARQAQLLRIAWSRLIREPTAGATHTPTYLDENN